MAMINLPPDFKEFLQLLKEKQVEYLVVGGYAVAFHGFPRPTGDIDIWIAVSPNNAALMVEVMTEFGFGGPHLNSELFLDATNMVRLGVPPVKIEILNRPLASVVLNVIFALNRSKSGAYALFQTSAKQNCRLEEGASPAHIPLPDDGCKRSNVE